MKIVYYPTNDWKWINDGNENRFQYVVGDNSGNLITSPLSADVVLAMVGFGAGGNTEAQFRKVLSLPTPSNLAATGYQALIDNLSVR